MSMWSPKIIAHCQDNTMNMTQEFTENDTIEDRLIVILYRLTSEPVVYTQHYYMYLNFDVVML